MNELLEWISESPVATVTAIALGAVVVLTIVTVYLVALAQGREVSFWPPRIGSRVLPPTHELTPTEIAELFPAGDLPPQQPGDTRAAAPKLPSRVLASLETAAGSHRTIRGTDKLSLPSIQLDTVPIALLQVRSGIQAGRAFVIGSWAREVTVGRSPECDVEIESDTFSRRHFRLTITPGESKGVVRAYAFELADLRSRNGTFVNGRKVTNPCKVVGGDLIEVGEVRFRLSFVG